MITSWSDFYRQLERVAADSRGAATLVDDSVDPASEQTVSEWPRTTAADVIAIVKTVDPLLGKVPLRPGSHGSYRAWEEAMMELESIVAIDPGDAREYDHNCSFWSSLLAVAAHLQAIDAPLPLDAGWRALRAQLARPPAARDAGHVERPHGCATDALTIEASDFPSMLAAQRSALCQLRGFDRRPGPADGAAMDVPRTTHDDALRLVNYWVKALVELQIKVLTGAIVAPAGFAEVQARWQMASEAVDQYAKAGSARVVYSSNEELWGAARALAVMLAALRTAPKPYDVVPFGELGLVGHAAARMVHALGDIAHGAQDELRWETGAAALIGGSVVLGLRLLLRRRRGRKES